MARLKTIFRARNIRKIRRRASGKMLPKRSLKSLLMRMIPLKKLDWYIIRKFLGTYVFSILLILAIVIVFDINEKIDNFMDHDAPLKKIIFDYYVNLVPYYANMFSSLFVFISVIFFTSKLADDSEIIAMQSCGMSFNRLMRPYFISAAVIALSGYMLGAYITPHSNKIKLDFEDQYVKRKKLEYVMNIQLEVDTGVIAYIERYENRTRTGYNFSLDKFKGKQLISHLTASSVEYDSTKARSMWKIRNYTLRNMDGRNEKLTRGYEVDSFIDMSPQDFLIMKGQQETMSSPELSYYIERQRQRGVGNLKSYEIEFHKRIAMSFAAFILVVIGLSLSARKIKGGMGMNIGIGLALSFSYLLFQGISSAFSVSGSIPPFVAVWLPNIVFSLIALYLYLYKAPR